MRPPPDVMKDIIGRKSKEFNAAGNFVGGKKDEQHPDNHAMRLSHEEVAKAVRKLGGKMPEREEQPARSMEEIGVESDLDPEKAEGKKAMEIGRSLRPGDVIIYDKPGGPYPKHTTLTFKEYYGEGGKFVRFVAKIPGSKKDDILEQRLPQDVGQDILSGFARRSGEAGEEERAGKFSSKQVNAAKKEF